MSLLRLRLTCLIVAATIFLNKAAYADSSDGTACAACGGIWILMIIAPLIIQVAILAWVVKDSRARGIESPLGWMAFVFLVPIVGILVYWFSRPPLKS